jgi:hypothetical protein
MPKLNFYHAFFEYLEASFAPIAIPSKIESQLPVPIHSVTFTSKPNESNACTCSFQCQG